MLTCSGSGDGWCLARDGSQPNGSIGGRPSSVGGEASRPGPRGEGARGTTVVRHQDGAAGRDLRGDRAVWRDADAIESIEHAWLFDHFAPINGHLDGPCLEGWTALAALAAETKRLRIGLMVTGNTYRHPAVLAKIAATVDVISNGRLDLGIGAGWNVYEHESMGIPLYAPGERIRRLGEACEIIRACSPST